VAIDSAIFLLAGLLTFAACVGIIIWVSTDDDTDRMF
jgi:hypothetical protein